MAVCGGSADVVSPKGSNDAFEVNSLQTAAPRKLRRLSVPGLDLGPVSQSKQTRCCQVGSESRDCWRSLRLLGLRTPFVGRVLLRVGLSRLGSKSFKLRDPIDSNRVQA